jgi:hypothetical protein
MVIIRLGGVFSSARARDSSHGKARIAEPVCRTCRRVSFGFIELPGVSFAQVAWIERTARFSVAGRQVDFTRSGSAGKAQPSAAYVPELTNGIASAKWDAGDN